jgi:penicillin amidase
MVVKWVRRVLVGLLIALGFAAAVGFWFRSASAPIIEGSIAAAGLGAPVSVVRDANAVPHIYAKNEDDAYFALGFVHAQDRLWQLEMNRRIYSGRLAEILGEAALPTDRFLRTLGVAENARHEVENYDAATRHVLERYAAGINAYLAQRHGPLPIEFLLTGAPAPEPWTPVDSAGWITMMAWDLSGNWGNEVLRMRLAQKLSKEQIDELLPPYPGNNGAPDKPLGTVDYTALYRQLKGTTAQLSEALAQAPPARDEGIGSNNWVVAGSRTASGKPLLANDPHLSLTAPALWYFAHLSAPGLEVIGATLPGVPIVVLGRTDRIAWGFTNTGPDTQDLYIEDVQDGKARTPNGWQPLAVREEVIKVKGRADVHLTVRASRHGPLVTDVSERIGHALAAVGGEHYAIAFDWAALRPDDRSMQAGVALNHAHDWASFLAAVRQFDSPEQNMVYADVEGNIGYVAPGRIPVRRADNDLKGEAPAPGWDARYDWIGWIPFEDLPQEFNPARGKIATANQKVVADDYKPYLTAEWEAPYRARRINQLLDANPHHELASFEAMQADQFSLAAVEALPLLLDTRAQTPAAGAAIERLAHWDGSMQTDRAEPLIYNAWMRELSREIYADELGPELFKESWRLRQVFVVNVLRNKGGEQRWCDDVTTPAVETCDELKARSLEVALADLARRYGADPERWRWGEAHAARSLHRPLGELPLVGRLFNIEVPVGGDNYTLNVGHYSVADESAPFRSHEGPSLRAIYDLADLERSEFIHSSGQSGNRLEPAYSNYAKRWSDVRYLPMQTRRETVVVGAMGTLVLTP